MGFMEQGHHNILQLVGKEVGHNLAKTTNAYISSAITRKFTAPDFSKDVFSGEQQKKDEVKQAAEQLLHNPEFLEVMKAFLAKKKDEGITHEYGDKPGLPSSEIHLTT